MRRLALLAAVVLLAGCGDKDAKPNPLRTALTGPSPVSSQSKRDLDQKTSYAKAHPTSAKAWSDVARAAFVLANANQDAQTGAFSAAGKQQLAAFDDAYQRYLKLTKQPEETLAALAAVAYGPGGTNQLDKATQAQAVVAERRPNEATYAQLAILAYQAGNIREGDLAAAKARSLAPKADRATLKQSLIEAKRAALTAIAGSPPPGSP